MTLNSEIDFGAKVRSISNMILSSLPKSSQVLSMFLRKHDLPCRQKGNIKFALKFAIWDCLASFHCARYDNTYFHDIYLRLKLKDSLGFIGFSRNFFNLAHILALLFLTLSFNACTPSPEPINYGEDECEYCRMRVTDNKYGSEIVTDKGKVYKFDSIECLIEFALEKNIIGDVNQTFLVTNFANPGNLIDTRTAVYVQNDDYRSPMGLNVSAFGSESEAQKFLSENDGRKLSWFGVIELVKQSIM